MDHLIACKRQPGLQLPPQSLTAPFVRVLHLAIYQGSLVPRPPQAFNRGIGFKSGIKAWGGLGTRLISRYIRTCIYIHINTLYAIWHLQCSSTAAYPNIHSSLGDHAKPSLSQSLPCYNGFGIHEQQSRRKVTEDLHVHMDVINYSSLARP